VDREHAGEAWRKGLADEAAQAARVRFARAATAGVEAVGRYLYVAGDLMRDDLAAGVSLAARMGGALARGTAALLDGGNAYGAAALLRQVVEVEYRFWTFAADPEDAARWLHASRSQAGGPLLARHDAEALGGSRPHGRITAAL
jgi:hypothetical protein